jgi:hypothetical protein
MNFEGQGTPIAIIKTSKTKNPPILSVDDKKTAQHSFTEYELKGDDKFQVIPNPNTERQIVYITAQSGAGKSWWCKEYCEEYKKIYPKREIYLFSSLAEDKSIDKIKGLKRINIKTSEFLSDEITAEDFQKSLVIFDDCDCITDKKLKNKIHSIMNNLLEIGRHWSCSLLITSHLPCAGNDTKRILNEAHQIVIFPHSLGGRSLKYLLESYLGLDKKQIKRVKQIDGRWVCIYKTYPQVIIGEQIVYTINNKDDD